VAKRFLRLPVPFRGELGRYPIEAEKGRRVEQFWTIQPASCADREEDFLTQEVCHESVPFTLESFQRPDIKQAV
jgi:hypothetical protein